MALDDITRDVENIFRRDLRSQTILVYCAIVTALLFAHADDFTSGPLSSWIQNYDNAVTRWIKSHPQKLAGALIFLPVTITSGKNYLATTAVALAWTWLVPESTSYQYIVQALAVHVYMRSQRATTQMAVCAAAAVAYYTGWIVLTAETTPNTAPNQHRTHTATRTGAHLTPAG